MNKYINRDYADKRWLSYQSGLIRSAFSVTVGAIAALVIIIFLES